MRGGGKRRRRDKQMGWQARAGAPFTTEKKPAFGTRGMVVTNHPLASAAGAEMLAAGGNAVDAAIAALFTLSVVEPMMVGPLGGGMAHLRFPDGRHTVIDGMSTCPLAMGPETFTPDPDATPGTMDAVGRLNAVGRTSVAAPGNLMAWTEMLSRFGTFSLDDVTEPAIRHASRGFRATPYLHDCVTDCAADMLCDPEISRVFLPDGAPIKVGACVKNINYAETLRLIARKGPGALYGGTLGKTYTDDMAQHGAYLAMEDLTGYRTREREILRGTYRGFEITGPPPPSSGPLHIAQMLNILEGYDIGALGFGSTDTVHLIAEVLKIAFADRTAATGDPDFIAVPVAKLLCRDYAAERRATINMARAQDWQAGVVPGEGAHTTHLTIADHSGLIVAATQTINSLFGARYMVPGTGMIPNNYMYVFTPHPGRANSIAPGKRVTSSMSPLIVLKEGVPQFALGLPGGLRIFPSAMQATINLIDHEMSVQEAVEAPRVWTQGFGLELEPGIPDRIAADLRARGHEILRVPNVAGGMCAIRFHDNGLMEGAGCWRADGTAIGLGGGHARPGVRFRPEATRT